MAKTKVAPPPRGKHRNRRAGHGYELLCRDLFRKIGFEHVVTSRSESRSRDDQKVDLINRDEYKNGRLPYNVQCKNVSRRIEYEKLLAELPQTEGVINVILHKMTTNKGRNNRSGVFVPVGTYALMSKRDFLRMAQMIVELQRANEVANRALKAFARKDTNEFKGISGGKP